MAKVLWWQTSKFTTLIYWLKKYAHCLSVTRSELLIRVLVTIDSTISFLKNTKWLTRFKENTGEKQFFELKTVILFYITD